MADDVTVDNGGLTDYIVATDDIGSNRQVQLVKPVFGADGTGTMLALGQGTMAASLPVTIASNQSGVPITDNGGSLTVDGTVAVTGTFWQATQPVSGTVAVSSISTSIVPGTAATNLGKARDTAIGATDTGIANLMVRRDAPTAETPAAGDYVVPQVSNQGAQYVHPTFSLAGGTVATLISAATTNATSVKASAGVLATIAAINNHATNWAYLKFHNTAGTPTAGSGVVATYGLPPSGGLTLALPTGMAFATGIGITVTGGITAADTTAVAASQVALTLTYH
jgi:hypothetical protein